MSTSVKKKRMPILRSPGVGRGASTPQPRVRFKLPSLQLNEVFSNFTKCEDTKPYEELVLTLRDAQLQDGELEQLLLCVRQCVPVLDESLHHFVNAFLNVQWVGRSRGVVEAYQDLLVELVSAHNYYIVFVLDALVSLFSQALKDEEWQDGVPSQQEVERYDDIHSVLQALLRVVPMSGEKLVHAVVKKFPYMKVGAHQQECFLYNVLRLIDQHPALAKDLMLLLVSRLVAMDVSMPSCKTVGDCKEVAAVGQQEVFDMEDVGVAHTLDVLMCKLLQYVKEKCCADWESSKVVYGLVLHVFERAVLPTHATACVQFLVFYTCSFRVTLAEAFINFLWRTAAAVNGPAVMRQAAVTYLASFLVRARYLTLNMLKSTLAEMAAWIHKYIRSQDEAESISVDVRLHCVFYSVCQALFYVVSCRHADLVDTRKNLTFLQSLGLAQIVTCALNPLRACQSVLVRRFAAVARTHQLAYCYTVMERNARSTMPVIYTDDKGLAVASATTSQHLDAVFPFEPLVLPRCRNIVAQYYRDFDYLDESEVGTEDMDAESEYSQEDDNDDFLEDMSLGTSAPDVLSVSMQ